MTTLIERFESKYVPEPNSGCWLWIGRRTVEGYGQMSVSGKRIAAHRLAFELFNGSLRQGMTIDHVCGVACCVNPAHLRQATIRDNVLRSGNPMAANARKTHCKYGHPFDSENTMIIKGYRQCRACRNRRRNAWRARLRKELH